METKQMTAGHIVEVLEKAAKKGLTLEAPKLCVAAAELIRQAYLSPRVPQAEGDFDIIRLIAAVETQQKLCEDLSDEGAKMYRDIAALLRTHPAFLNPPPLTRDQLMGMAGKTIWVEDKVLVCNCWAICDQTGDFCTGVDGTRRYFTQYGDRWLAYLYPVMPKKTDQENQVDGVTASQILAVVQLTKADEFRMGNLYSSFLDFIEDVKARCVIDYDGIGELAVDGQIVTNATICLANMTVTIDKTLLVSFEALSNLLGNRVNVFWYNK